GTDRHLALHSASPDCSSHRRTRETLCSSAPRRVWPAVRGLDASGSSPGSNKLHPDTHRGSLALVSVGYQSLLAIVLVDNSTFPTPLGWLHGWRVRDWSSPKVPGCPSPAGTSPNAMPTAPPAND